MSKQENILAFILASLKGEIQRIDLNNLLAFVSTHIKDENFFKFIMTDMGIFSYELENIIKKYKEKNLLNSNGVISIINKKEISTRAQKVHIDMQMNILKLIKKFHSDTKASLECIAKEFMAPKNKMPENILFTAGYEGRSVDAFIQRILKAGIHTLVDVRYNPVSRKFGFSKGQLSSICHSVNITYNHMQSLGIPSESRKKLNCKQDYQNLFSEYEKNILDVNIEEQEKLIKIASITPTVLICYEADKELCHRTRLAKRISKKSGMKVVDI